MASAPPYIVDPSDPRGPSLEMWNPVAPGLIDSLSKMVQDTVQREQQLLAELDEQRERAEEARGQAEEARGRAERLADKLRKLGIDPDSD